MKERRALMLANAGLIAGLALGSIAISNAAAPQRPAITADMRSAVPSRSHSAPAGATARAGGSGGGRLADLVAALGHMDVRDVAWQRHARLSLSGIARAKGLAPGYVVGLVVRELSTALAADVASGRIDEPQKDRVLADERARLAVAMDAQLATSVGSA